MLVCESAIRSRNVGLAEADSQEQKDKGSDNDAEVISQLRALKVAVV